MKANEAEATRLLLIHEGGDDDDDRDPGGRTSRGILQSEWDVYRRGHIGRPVDVWEASQSDVLAIYHQKYWAVLKCDDLPPGVDYAVFDYGVNSGVSRAAKVLQGVVGAEVDGEIGPETISKTKARDAAKVINAICDERMVFLRGLKTWPTFKNGWTRRVSEVRAAALKMATQAPQSADKPASGFWEFVTTFLMSMFNRNPTEPKAGPGDKTPWLTTMRAITGTLEQPGADDNPVILAWAREIGERFPETRAYCARYNHDAIAWCGLTMAICMARNGIRPVFGLTDTDKFLWAQAWKQFGTKVTGQAQPGDVLVLARHVTLCDGVDGNYYIGRGGNQSDSVKTSRYAKGEVEAIRRPPSA